MTPVVIEDVRVVAATPASCDDCGARGAPLTLCGVCARDLLPEPKRQADAPAGRPGRRRRR